MKNILLFIISVSLFSCGSDNLSNSKAKNIISKCLQKNPEQRFSKISLKKITFSTQEHDQKLLQKYLKLNEEGYLDMELIKAFTKGWRKDYKEYNIKLTDKALEYMSEIPENGKRANAKTFKYVIEEVLEVHETPSLNIAKVKVKYKASEITPFAIFSNNDPSEFWIADIIMSKTSNGWKYCDNF